MWQTRLAGALVVTLAVGTAAHAALDPLSENLRKLEQRAQPAPKKAAEPARPRRARRVVASTPRPRLATPREAAHAALPNPSHAPSPGEPSLTSYTPDRFGAKVKAGDLWVSAHSSKGMVHVYVRQRLVSNNGNGVARVPDLAPGKYPVLLFSPGDGKRKTYWVTVRPGSLASLSVNL